MDRELNSHYEGHHSHPVMLVVHGSIMELPDADDFNAENVWME